jgi:conjugative relaxase-like TrwC/TraI family protein
MVIVTPVSPAAADYYFRGQGPGRWVGQGSAGLGLSGEVARRDLVAVLRGCRPGDGRYLPAVKPARRRAGWDLTLAAPKSLSLLGAMAGGDSREVDAAHRGAVDDVVADFERRLLTLRRAGAPGGRVAAVGLVGAAFEHGVNAAGEPHLHSHLLVGNLGCDAAGGWSAINCRWWVDRLSVGSVYQLALRQHLRARGLALEWRLRDDGMADVAGVPRAAVRSASGRGRAAAAAQADFGAREGRKWGTRVGATVQTRRAAVPQPWRARAVAAGLGPDEAAALVRSAQARAREGHDGAPAGAGRRDLVGAVTDRLAAQRSSFRAGDVVVALAACHPDGMAGIELERWVAGFCGRSMPVPVEPGAAPRWTSAVAHRADQRLLALGVRSHRGGMRLDPAAVESALAGYPGLSDGGRSAASELLSNPSRVHVLSALAGRTNLLAQAAVIEVAATAWQAAGLHVAVATSTDEGPARWQALTGLDPAAGGAAADWSGLPRADVIIVDHADRRATSELVALLAETHRDGAAAVLIEGGTAPRLSWMRSDGLAALGDRLGRLDPGPVPAWTRGALPPSGHLPLERDIGACADSASAAGHLLARWAREWTAGTPTTLVGLGYAEVDGLNQSARAALVGRGIVAGPALECGGRVLQAGDRVLALRRVAPDVPRGASLTVVGLDAARAEVTVATQPDGRNAVALDRRAAAHLGYGYAMTPPLAARTPGPMLVLGPPAALGPHQSRVLAASWVASRSAGLDRVLDRAVPPAVLDQAAWRSSPAAAARRDHGIELGW